MEPFPNLTNNQVALIRADKKTGHVLDERLLLTLDDNQKVYTVFDSLNKAQIFAVEIVIFSSKEDVLFYSNK